MREKPRLSFGQIWNMSFGFFGIQFAFGLQQANMSGIFTTLNAKQDQLPLLWLAAPLTGLIVQPIIGSLSDRTWNRFGRRRPYFFGGAIFSAIALFIMPYSTAVGMAVFFLAMLDASINVSMEPFRAFVADKLNVEQRTAGFVMQSFFIGAGAAISSALPYILTAFGVNDNPRPGYVAATIKYSFQIGAVVLLLSILWTVFTSTEYPPDDMAEFERQRQEERGFGNWLRGIISAMREMPQTMKHLAIVQVFTWLGLFCMWIFFNSNIQFRLLGAIDADVLKTNLQLAGQVIENNPILNANQALLDQGTKWNGICFAMYSVVCFVVAFALPKLAAMTGRKRVHAGALICGGVALLSTYFIQDYRLLLLTMVGIGIAWASILSMPYAILSSALPPARMGVYMGIFNFFIVLPEITASLTFQPIVKYVFRNNPLYMIMFGGACMLAAAVACLLLVRDTRGSAPEAAVIKGDEQEHFTTQGTAQPVPSTGLLDDEGKGH